MEFKYAQFETDPNERRADTLGYTQEALQEGIDRLAADGFVPIFYQANLRNGVVLDQK